MGVNWCVCRICHNEFDGMPWEGGVGRQIVWGHQTREHWFYVDNVASSVIAEGAPRTVVQIANIAGVGDVKYLAKSHDAGLPKIFLSDAGPGRGRKRRSSASPIFEKKKSSVASLSPVNPLFEAALEKRFTE